MFNRKSINRALAGFLLTLATQLAVALPEDQQQPIHVTSDSAIQENDIATYKGHVVMIQGSLHVWADLVVVHHSAGKLDRIVATGAPVRFNQQPEITGGLVTGYSDTLIYHHTDQRLELLQNALVDRDASTVKGNRIEYLIPTKTVKAEGTADSHQGQVEMVLQPGAISGKADTPTPTPATQATPAPGITPASGDAPTPTPPATGTGTAAAGKH